MLKQLCCQNEVLKIVSIDIGIENLAIIEANITYEEYEKYNHERIYDLPTKGVHELYIKEIEKCHLVDIQFLSEYCNDRSCTLHHSKCPADYMSHVFKEYPIFDTCDKILIEQQPPMGLICIQELIRFNYREKTIIISPNSMHSYFKINKKHHKKYLENTIENTEEDDYEYRKRKTIEIADPYLVDLETYKISKRKHDMADAVCYLVYWIHVENERLEEEKNMHGASFVLMCRRIEESKKKRIEEKTNKGIEEKTNKTNFENVLVKL